MLHSVLHEFKKCPSDPEKKESLGVQPSLFEFSHLGLIL